MRIEATLRASAGDHRQAAITICRLLDGELGLASNGWFEDDDEMRAILDSTSGLAASNLFSRPEDHWDTVDARIRRSLTRRLQAANEDVTPSKLLRELDACTDAEFEALDPEMQGMGADERDSIRTLMRAGLWGDARRHACHEEVSR